MGIQTCRTQYPAFRKILILGLCLMVSSVWPTGPSSAEIYRWKDEKGVWHFTEGPGAGSSSQPARDTKATGTEPMQELPPPPGSDVKGGLLWRIQGSGNAPSYLLGTIHSDDPRVTRLRPAVAKKLDGCHQFVMEMEIDSNAIMQFGADMLITSGDDLESLLGADLYTKVVAAMADYGMPEMAVRQLKPWVVMALLSMPKPTGGMILDMVLHQRAISQGKPTSGLETAKEQMAVFEGLPLQDQIALLKMTIDQLDALPRMFEELIAAYAADNLGRIASLAEQYNGLANSAAAQRFLHRLNDERNRRMAQRIIPYLKQGNAFIAVGALHLAGPHGLLSLLEQKGYRADPVR